MDHKFDFRATVFFFPASASSAAVAFFLQLWLYSSLYRLRHLQRQTRPSEKVPISAVYTLYRLGAAAPSSSAKYVTIAYCIQAVHVHVLNLYQLGGMRCHQD